MEEFSAGSHGGVSLSFLGGGWRERGFGIGGNTDMYVASLWGFAKLEDR